MSCQSQNDRVEKAELNKTDTSIINLVEKENQLDTLLNTYDYLILGSKIVNVKVVKENEIMKFPTFEILNEYRDDVIIGENIKDDSLIIYRKYNLKTTFKDFPAELYKGKLADPDFSTNPDSKSFITRIKNECAKGINFAGHYTLVIWGCGSPCQSGVLVDRLTGKIYDGFVSELGSEFNKNSRMIVRNVGAIDSSTNLIEICLYCKVNHIIWTGAEFKEVE